MREAQNSGTTLLLKVANLNVGRCSPRPFGSAPYRRRFHGDISLLPHCLLQQPNLSPIDEIVASMLRACKPSNISRATGNVVSSVRPTTRCCPNSSAYNRVSFSVQSTSRTFRPRIGCTPTSHRRITAPCVGTIVVGCAWSMWAPSLNLTTTTSCEVARVEESSINEKSLSIRVRSVDDRNKKSVWATTKRAIRLIKRMLKLTIALSPIVILYPLQYLLTAILSLPATKEDKRQDAHQVALASSLEVPDGPLGWYYKVCLHCVEWSGAAAIKLMQWAGSRPDMFGQSFCAVFSQLQDDTTPHAWKHTERALRQAYGEDWQEHIRLDEILGSGCIAQVYKGVICDDNGKEQHVAVKVMHPNVEDDIDSDLDLMRLATHILEWMPFDLLRDVKWLNLPGIVEEMATLLKIQLDLRTEADHLVRFNENFKDNDMIIFPKVCVMEWTLRISTFLF